MGSRATDGSRASKCQQKWPDQTSTTVRATRGADNRPHLVSVLQEGRKSANIHASSGAIRGIPVYAA